METTPIMPTNSQEKPKLSLDEAKTIVQKYEKLRHKFTMAQSIYERAMSVVSENEPVARVAPEPIFSTEPQESKQEQPSTPVEQLLPTLEQARSDYAQAVIQSRKKVPGDSWLSKKLGIGETVEIDPVSADRVKSLRATYEQVLTKNELSGNSINERLAFLKQEKDAFNRDVLNYDNAEKKQRVTQTINKFISNTSDTVKNLAYNTKGRLESLPVKETGFNLLRLIAIAGATPTLLAGKLGTEMNKKWDSSMDLLKKKFAQSNTKETTKKDVTKKPLEEKNPVEVQKSPEDRKNEFLEKTFGGKLEGDLLNQWNALKNIKMERFIFPEDANWGLDMNGKNAVVTPHDYPTPAKTLYDKLAPVFKKAKESKVVIPDGVRLDSYLQDAIKNNLI